MIGSTGVGSIRLLILLAVAVLGMASGLQAAPIALTNYGCSAPNASDCNGHTYAVWAEKGNNGDWLINVGVLTGSNGAIFAIGIKDFAASYTVPNGNADESLFGVPDGDLNNWVTVQQELNANGCQGGGSGGLCTEYGDPNGLGFASSENLIWTFKVNAPGGLNDTLHLKYMFVDGVDKKGNPNKVGSLGSYDINFACGVVDACPDDPAPPPPSVPEPSTMGMLGAGLIGLALFARKRIS